MYYQWCTCIFISEILSDEVLSWQLLIQVGVYFSSCDVLSALAVSIFFRILIFLLNISMYNKRGYIIATTFLLQFFTQVYWCLQFHCTVCSPKLLQPCILLWWPILPHPWSPSAAVRLPPRPVLTCWPHSASSPLTGMFTRGRNWHPSSTVVSWNIAKK